MISAEGCYPVAGRECQVAKVGLIIDTLVDKFLVIN